jgi:hypothetical protein
MSKAKGKAKVPAAGKAKAKAKATDDATYGCSKCRWSQKGCAQCRNPDFAGCVGPILEFESRWLTPEWRLMSEGLWDRMLFW